MSNCVNCGDSITEANISEEHLIPNALGGRLTSKALLCRKCNNAIAHVADNPMIEQFSAITTLLDISRERGTVPDAEGTLPDGTEVVISPDGKPSMKHPVYNAKAVPSGTEIHFSARTEKEMADFIKSMVKKFPQINPEQMQNAVKRESKRLPEPVKIPFRFGGDSFFKGILKIAFEFHLVRAGGLRLHDQFLKMLFDESTKVPLGCIFYSHGFEPFPQLSDQEVYHSISLVGTAKECMLYAHITLFSFMRTVVILDDNYDGTDCQYAYIQNAITGEVLSASKHEVLNRSQIEALQRQKVWPPAKFISELNRVIGIGIGRMEVSHMGEIFGECLNRWGKKYDGQLITGEMANELVGDYRMALESWLGETKQGGNRT